MLVWHWRFLALAAAALLLGVVVHSILSPSAPAHTTVGSYFDHPPAWPGPPWSRNGEAVSNEVVESAAGPAHCGWESATLMTIGWPPGTNATSSDHARQYVRDTLAALHDDPFLHGSFERNPELPLDVADSGFRYGTLKLYLAPSDEDRYVYLVAPAD
jgi:hypothetical protein